MTSTKPQEVKKECMSETISEFVENDTFIIASQIAYFRRLKGLTQKELANLCGMKEQMIQRLEKTPDCRLTASTVVRVASAMDLRVKIDLIGNTE